MHLYMFIYAHDLFTLQPAASNHHHCKINNRNKVTAIMGEFTPICQRHIDVMAHKNYLQHLLFHKTHDAKVIMELTTVIINLQVLANTLQTLQVCCYIQLFNQIVIII